MWDEESLLLHVQGLPSLQHLGHHREGVVYIRVDDYLAKEGVCVCVRACVF